MTPAVHVPILTDGAVRLRALDEGDVQGCYEQCVDPLSVQWTTVPVPFTLDDARQFCLEIVPGMWAEDSQWVFAVEADGRYAGNIGLRDRGSGRAEIAFGSHPWVRGTGHMHTALRMLLDWGFTARDLHAVSWMANVGNWASRKTAWRLGFTFVGTMPSWMAHRGELFDGWVAVLGRSDPREPQTRWLTSPVLELEGLRLRPVVAADDPRIVEACADERTRRWLTGLPSPYLARHATQWRERIVEKQATGTGTTWAVCAAEHPARLLGAVSLFDLTEHDAEVGYWTHPDARGRGVMTRAVRLVVSHAFDELGVGLVRALAEVENGASRHVLEGGGLLARGRSRGMSPTGVLQEDVRYDLLATEWESLRR